LYYLSDKDELNGFIIQSQINHIDDVLYIGFINYELAFRRPELLQLKDFTLLLDESSLIQNEMAKRTKFIMKLNFKNLILLSGTPTSGKYENLWSQLHLLGWNISKDLYWRQYIDTEIIDNQGFPIKVVKGYKNVQRLKQKMRDYGCRFLKTEEVFDLPEQVFNTIWIDTTKEYKKFKKDRIITIGETEFVGDTTLTKMLYERMLCGSYNDSKLEALKDLIQSTEDRLIVFYNFNEELRAIEDLCLELERPLSIVNGQTKDLSIYEEYENSVTAIQYQAGSMGLNLQKANKIVYFTPPLSSELFEQSKKRTHRIGQAKTCFYYELTCKNSIEEKIYKTLEMRKDYTNDLFEMEET
jgi:SNF2 family DNA or RNA helicase